MDFNPMWLLFPVPDAPQNLQLSLHREVEGVIMCHWAPPIHTHGLIREYIVSSSQEWAVLVGEHGRWPGLLEQNHVLCDADSPYNHPSAGTLCIPPSPLSSCLFVRCYDAQTFGTCSWYSIFIFIFLFLSLQVEYSRSGSKMWASQRALTNFTEIRNLLVNTQYMVRVSVRTRFSHLAGWPGNMGRWLYFHENSMPSLTRC